MMTMGKKMWKVVRTVTCPGQGIPWRCRIIVSSVQKWVREKDYVKCEVTDIIYLFNLLVLEINLVNQTYVFRSKPTLLVEPHPSAGF